MSDEPKSQEPSDGLTLPCPRCGKPMAPFMTDCPECEVKVISVHHHALVQRHQYNFGLGELMLVIGSIAIVLGVARISLAAAVFVGIVVLVALIRTLGALHRARGWKVNLSTMDVMSLIATSLGIAFLIIVSSAIAFFATCVPTGMIGMVAPRDSFWSIFVLAGVGIGLVAAFWVAWKLYKSLWMSGSPAKLMGIRYLEDPPPPIPHDPEPPK